MSDIDKVMAFLDRKNEMVLANLAERPPEADWKKAFVILALQSCTGWINSTDVSRYVMTLDKAGQAEAARTLATLFNTTRSKFEQDFMG